MRLLNDCFVRSLSGQLVVTFLTLTLCLPLSRNSSNLLLPSSIMPPPPQFSFSFSFSSSLSPSLSLSLKLYSAVGAVSKLQTEEVDTGADFSPPATPPSETGRPDDLVTQSSPWSHSHNFTMWEGFSCYNSCILSLTDTVNFSFLCSPYILKKNLLLLLVSACIYISKKRWQRVARHSCVSTRRQSLFVAEFIRSWEQTNDQKKKSGCSYNNPKRGQGVGWRHEHGGVSMLSFVIFCLLEKDCTILNALHDESTPSNTNSLSETICKHNQELKERWLSLAPLVPHKRQIHDLGFLMGS